ncbi:MAG: hypothetical protein Q4E53_13695 [Eubacteriales bacterium]|nr:hypothetical protein [Eubacteriales bacterium]
MKRITTKIKMILFTSIQGIAMLAFFLLYRSFRQQWMLSLAITLLTIFYHFAMRLVVGEVITVIFKNREFPQDRWGFPLYDFEKGLYRKLRVKQWKMSMITAKPEQFDLKQVSLKELLHNMMQAELVHRIIMILSFLPLFFIIPFGEPIVFIVTSIIACMMDSIFVIIQRYNRPRVVKLIKFVV